MHFNVPYKWKNNNNFDNKRLCAHTFGMTTHCQLIAEMFLQFSTFLSAYMKSYLRTCELIYK